MSTSRLQYILEKNQFTLHFEKVAKKLIKVNLWWLLQFIAVLCVNDDLQLLINIIIEWEDSGLINPVYTSTTMKVIQKHI